MPTGDVRQESESRAVGAREPLYGAVEGGGTKINCAVGRSADRMLERATFACGSPEATLSSIAAFFAAAQRTHGTLAALGVAFFGPLELHRDQPRYGRLLDTPKAGWSGADVLGTLQREIGVPVAIDTDVGAAALAEWRLGAGRGAASVAYVTVGTGVGVGFAPDLARASRPHHPEGGHLLVRRLPEDRFDGICPFHGDCLEGLASGPAIRARWGGELSSLAADHGAWPTIGYYLGQLAATISLLAPVERIVFGGGVASGGGLLPYIRAAALDALGRYVGGLNDTAAMDRYICSPGLGDQAGIAGAFLMAADEWTRAPSGCEEPNPARTR